MKIKIIFALVGLVTFLCLGINQHINSDPNKYIRDIKERTVFASYTIDALACERNVKTSDTLTITVKENGAKLTGRVGVTVSCDLIKKMVGKGSVVSSHIDSISNELMSLQVNDKWILKYDKYLQNRKNNYSNYSIVYFVIAFSFLMFFLTQYQKKE
ncbi:MULTISPECIES: hypothetical protein [unclassified Pseudoalteromonas]|uniref:hypothetical protein n=1 Tax=unclassified Pseudoalteromonas TaxID=194690 RepID=UPI0005AB7107|nr:MULTISPECIES: hypothetical protein [unclassified Pseudoalteromonas]